MLTKLSIHGVLVAIHTAAQRVVSTLPSHRPSVGVPQRLKETEDKLLSGLDLQSPGNILVPTHTLTQE